MIVQRSWAEMQLNFIDSPGDLLITLGIDTSPSFTWFDLPILDKF